MELMETKDICSPASNRGKFQTVVTVDAKSSYSAPFVIVPLALGRHSIEVKASALGRGSDGVKKDLLVVVRKRNHLDHKTKIQYVGLTYCEDNATDAGFIQGRKEMD